MKFVAFLFTLCSRLSFEKKNQNGRLKKLNFLKSPILKKILLKFHGMVLELVGLIHVKDIDVAQPIWLRDCPT